ncbi:MAG TPA: hypothetical protein VJM33_05710 [Microthrixaceae bacterium]|nr:hypothetical protein [Microthrixaceae bacterium]
MTWLELVFARVEPASAARPARRITRADVEAVLLDDAPAYVCGSAGFAEAASQLLVGAGVPVERIRVDRFGRTGA